MNSQTKPHSNKLKHKLSPKVQSGLIISLVIISLFPLFITFAPGEWPLPPTVIVIDVAYIAILAGYVLVLTGRNHSQWLIITMTVISIFCVVGMGWLVFALATLKIS